MGDRTVVEAVVVTGTTETPYRRAGRGATVLLLGAGVLFDQLAETLRVVEPLRIPPVREAAPADRTEAPDDTAWRDWLRGLVDGLGLDRPALLVGAGLEAAVRRAVGEDPYRFGPVIEAGTAAQVRAALAISNEIIDV